MQPFRLQHPNPAASKIIDENYPIHIQKTAFLIADLVIFFSELDVKVKTQTKHHQIMDSNILTTHVFTLFQWKGTYFAHSSFISTSPINIGRKAFL